MANPPVEQRKKEAELRAAHAEAQEPVVEEQEARQAELAEFASLTPGEKSDITRRRELSVRREHAKAQQKARKAAVQNKAITPATEDKGDDLDSVDFTTESVREAAAEAGLTAENFKRRKKSSDRGFTKADVERIAAQAED